MTPDVPRAAFRLSWAVAALAAAASLAGLLGRDVYRDPETFIDAGWIGNDLVTLAAAVPALAASTWKAASSPRARLVWLGCLAFMLYNYAFYLFGAAPNPLLAAYAALTALSLLALLLGLLAMAPPEPWTCRRGARRFLVGYMGLWAVALAGLWLVPAALFAASGKAPDLNGSTHAFRVTAALDLTLVVPYVALAAVLLARKSPWGRPVATILNVKGILYPLVLVASSTTAARAGVDGALALVPLWAGFAAASSVATFLLLRSSP